MNVLENCMKKNLLGTTGIEVTAAGFGVLPMGPSQLALPLEEGAAILRYALDIIKESQFNFNILKYYNGKSGYNVKIKDLLKHCEIFRKIASFSCVPPSSSQCIKSMKI